MAPIAVTKEIQLSQVKNTSTPSRIGNPFYSPPVENDNDSSYKYSQYKPSFPKIDWAPLEEQPITHRGISADPEKRALLGSATKVTHLTPALGVEITGLDLRQLSDVQKDELALLVAERSVVFFRDQKIDIHAQLELASYFGPLHKHATTPVPREPGLEAVHVVYHDGPGPRPDTTKFAKLELFHSDVSYEIQPPGVTSLKLYTCPPVGGDTIWSSGYALYSSLSPGFQRYLEGLNAVHSAVAQAEGARAAGTHVRRQEIETIHPVVRVHPVTGWKSVYVNPGFTRFIVGVPKAESDKILEFLFQQIAENPDFQVRFKWETDSIAFWDNRIVTHSAIFDYWPARRHALRATPHAERPISVADYERDTGKKAGDRQVEVWRAQGLDVPVPSERPRGYND